MGVRRRMPEDPGLSSFIAAPPAREGPRPIPPPSNRSLPASACVALIRSCCSPGGKLLFVVRLGTAGNHTSTVAMRALDHVVNHFLIRPVDVVELPRASTLLADNEL